MVHLPPKTQREVLLGILDWLRLDRGEGPWMLIGDYILVPLGLAVGPREESRVLAEREATGLLGEVLDIMGSLRSRGLAPPL